MSRSQLHKRGRNDQRWVQPETKSLLLCQKHSYCFLLKRYYKICWDIKMEPQEEKRKDFTVVNSPQDVINTFHVPETGPQHILVMLQNHRGGILQGQLSSELWSGQETRRTPQEEFGWVASDGAHVLCCSSQSFLKCKIRHHLSLSVHHCDTVKLLKQTWWSKRSVLWEDVVCLALRPC